MSDILFDPKNISSKIPRDVLNIIGTYTKHPLCDVIKKGITYKLIVNGIDNKLKSIIIFNNISKYFKYDEYFFGRWLGNETGIAGFGYFERFLCLEGIMLYPFINSKFEIKIKNGICYLQNKIPVHRDTFMTEYYFLDTHYIHVKK